MFEGPLRSTKFAVALMLLMSGCDFPRPELLAPPDAASPAMCDPLAPFDRIVPVMGLAGAGPQGTCRLSPDELTLYFSADDIYVATRATREAAFGAPVTLAINSSEVDYDPYITPDGMTLVFGSARETTGQRVWRAQASDSADGFTSPAMLSPLLAGLADADDEKQPFLSWDESQLWFVSSLAATGTQGQAEIWRVPRTAVGFGTPVLESQLNSSRRDWLPMVSADQLTIYFASDRPVTPDPEGTLLHIWRSHRDHLDDEFPPPTPVTELNSGEHNTVPGWLSKDNCRLYFPKATLNYTESHLHMAVRDP
ncbi:MAG: TolB family protein [Kofleriaceae bacterium]